MLMPEFVAQERDIFRMNLMIGKETREMNQLKHEMDNGQQTLQDLRDGIEKQSHEIKMQLVQVESTVANALMAAEAAVRHRMEMQSHTKRLRDTTETMRAQIIKNEDSILVYRTYREFFECLSEIRPFEWRTNPDALVNRFEDFEQENLFLVQTYEALAIEAEKKASNIKALIHKLEGGIVRVLKDSALIPVYHAPTYRRSEKGRQEGERIDQEIQYLGKLVRRSYTRSFGNAQKMSVMGMLEHFESTIENLHKKFALVTPAFAAKKQKQQEEERKKQRRLEAQEQRIAEQQLKIDQAIQRARQPKREKSGRPLMRRMLPVVFRVDDAEAVRIEQAERKRVEKLLFQADDD
jgi:hypothetical protein